MSLKCFYVLKVFQLKTVSINFKRPPLLVPPSQELVAEKHMKIARCINWRAVSLFLVYEMTTYLTLLLSFQE